MIRHCIGAMPKISGLAALALLLLAGSCSQPTTPQSISKEIEKNHLKWKSFQIGAYRIQQRRFCFCVAMPGFVELQVVGREVVSGRSLESGELVAGGRLVGYQSVDALFAWLQQVAAQDPVQLDIEYDPKYGYPTHVAYDQSLQVVDEELTLDMRALQIGLGAPQDSLQCSEGQALVVADSLPRSLVTDAFDLQGLAVQGDTLDAVVAYSGGCREHCLDLIMAPAIFKESIPVQADVFLVHDGREDACEAQITEHRRFDLTPLARLYRAQYGGADSVQINVIALVDGVRRHTRSLMYFAGQRAPIR